MDTSTQSIGGTRNIIEVGSLEDANLRSNAGVILEANAAVESVRQAYDGTTGEPRPEWVRGTCPQCDSPVVSNCYYVGGKGFLVVWECWASLQETPTCGYRKVL